MRGGGLNSLKEYIKYARKLQHHEDRDIVSKVNVMALRSKATDIGDRMSGETFIDFD